jgi:cytochrome c peroxidase
MERLALSLWLVLTTAVLAGCADGRNVAPLSSGFPTLPVPAGTTLTEARVNVGQRLFYDKQVSRTHGISCSDCQGSRTQPTSGAPIGPATPFPSPAGVDALFDRP